MSDQGVTGGDVWIVSSTGGAAPRPHSRPSHLRPHGSHGTATSTSLSAKSLAATAQLVRSARSRQRQRSHRLRLARLQHSRRPSAPAASTQPLRHRRPLPLRLSRQHLQPPPRRRSSPPRRQCTRTLIHLGLRSPGLTQLSHFNDGVQPAWGKSVSLTWTNDNFHVQGWLLLPAHYDPAKEVPAHRRGPRRSRRGCPLPLERRCGGLSATAFSALGYFVLMPNPRGSLRPGRSLHPGQPQGLRLRRPARHPRRRRHRSGQIPRRPQPRRHHRLELWRIHDHVRRHPDPPLPRRRRRRGHLRLAFATTAKTPSTSG